MKLSSKNSFKDLYHRNKFQIKLLPLLKLKREAEINFCNKDIEKCKAKIPGVDCFSPEGVTGDPESNTGDPQRVPYSEVCQNFILPKFLLQRRVGFF